MSHSEFSFIPLLIVSALAFLVPVLLTPVKRYGIPVVVGEIIAGIVFGQSGFNLIHSDVVLRVLSELGFAYLMFLSGLEIDFSGTRREKPGSVRRRLLTHPFVLGGVMFALSAGFSLLAGFGMTRYGLTKDPWIMAMILTTTSLGVVAPVLKERGLTENAFGQTILVSALLADFLTILFIGAYVLILGEGANARLLLVLVLFAAFVLVYRLGARFQQHAPTRRVMQVLSTATAQIRVRAAFAIVLVFMGIANSLGVVNILGAFMAGVIIAMLSSRGSSVLREKLDAIGYGFFIPIFFIMVGVKFDLAALLASERSLLMVPVLLGAAYLVKLLATLVMRFAFSWRETFAASALLSARLSFIVAVAEIGMQLGVISKAVDAAIILVAIVTCTVSPVAFSAMLPRKHLAGDRTFVIGSRLGAGMLAQRLAAHDLDVELIRDIQPAPDQEGGGGSRAELVERLRKSGLADADTLVAMSESRDETLQLAKLAREVFNTRNVIAWVDDPADNVQFREAGVRVVNPQYSTLLMVEGLVTNPTALSIGADPDENQAVRSVKLQNPRLAGRAIGDLHLPASVRVLRIVRGAASLVSEKNLQVQVNDVLTLCGETGEVDQCARLFAKR